MTLTDNIKQKIRAALYAKPSNKELAEFTGKAPNHVSQNKTDGGHAYNVDVLTWKIDKVCEACEDHEDIMTILALEPSGVELSDYAGVTPPAISSAKKKASESNHAYAYAYYLLSYRVEKIAELVGA